MVADTVCQPGGAPVIHTRIADFVAHLAAKDLTEDELCEYLVTNTLSFLGVTGAWICEITNRDTVRARASFGVDQSQFSQWQEFPLDWRLPVSDALREQRFLWINTLPHWPEEYTTLHQVNLSPEIKSMIVIPVLRVGNSNGCIGFFSNQALNPDVELELMLRTVTNLVSLQITRQKNRKTVDSASVNSLTDRQLHILSLISQKLTNGEIAEQMGYSESTIRQETMRIFDKLQVQGRHEARTYFEANKIKLGFTSKSNTPLEVVKDFQEATGS